MSFPNDDRYGVHQHVLAGSAAPQNAAGQVQGITPDVDLSHDYSQELFGDNADGYRDFFSPEPAFEADASSEALRVARICATSGLGFVFDIDGVLLRSDTPIPGASETLHHLRNIGIPFVFLTNSGGQHEAVRVQNLSSQLNVPITNLQFIQSHTLFRHMVEELGNKNVLVIGGVDNSCREVAERYGFRSVITPADIITQYPKYWPFTEIGKDYYTSFARPLPAPINPFDPENSLKIDAIMVFSSSRDWGMDIQLIIDLVVSENGVLGTESHINGLSDATNNGWQQNGQPSIFFSNPDFHWPTDWAYGPRISQGAFIAALEAVFAKATGYTAKLQSHKAGKPHLAAFRYAELALLQERSRVCQSLGLADPESGVLRHVIMVGDNPRSDIAGANEFNVHCGPITWDSALVRTGVWREGMPDGFPVIIEQDVKEAVNAALRSKNLPVVSEW